jgi:DNA-binding NarL/FixJ family response regulator
MSIRTVIVDDDRSVTKVLGLRLDSEPDIHVVGTANSGEAALELARKKPIDVAIVDIRLPGMSGIEITRELLKVQPEMKVIGLTGDFVKARVDKMLASGAQGLVIKGGGAHALCEAVRKVHSGDLYFCELTAKRLFSDHLNGLRKEHEKLLERLTPRELEILQLVLEGCCNRDIAHRLDVAKKTVEGHRTRMMKKLEMNSTVELTKFGIRIGLVSVLD